jgi:uncharacterized protein
VYNCIYINKTQNDQQFIWNVAKNEINKSKHGISFELASKVFNDINSLAWQDTRYTYGEERWVTLGEIYHQVVVIVVYVIKGEQNEEEIIRIISARKANNKERQKYRQYKFKRLARAAKTYEDVRR